MKSTVVDESLSSMNLQFCSRGNQLLQLLQQNEKPKQKNKTKIKCQVTVHECNSMQTKKSKSSIITVNHYNSRRIIFLQTFID